MNCVEKYVVTTEYHSIISRWSLRFHEGRITKEVSQCFERLRSFIDFTAEVIVANILEEDGWMTCAEKPVNLAYPNHMHITF